MGGARWSFARPLGLNHGGSAGLQLRWLRGWGVAERNDTSAEWPGFEELERHLVGASLEQVLAGADHNGVPGDGYSARKAVVVLDAAAQAAGSSAPTAAMATPARASAVRPTAV
jgi:hypothetical protein